MELKEILQLKPAKYEVKNGVPMLEKNLHLGSTLQDMMSIGLGVAEYHKCPLNIITVSKVHGRSILLSVEMFANQINRRHERCKAFMFSIEATNGLEDVYLEPWLVGVSEIPEFIHSIEKLNNEIDVHFDDGYTELCTSNDIQVTYVLKKACS